MPVDVRREGSLLLAAAALLTRIPLPPPPYDPGWLPRAAKYMPLVGLGIGAGAGAVWLTAGFVFPATVAAVLAVATALLVTGALHEDGLADTADSLGGRTKEARLAIMRDSRIGAYGVLALVCCLLLRVGALAAMTPEGGALALLAAGAAGRFAAVAVMHLSDYGGNALTARSSPAGRPTRGETLFAALFGLLPLLLLPVGAIVAGLVLAGFAAAWLALVVCRPLGGHTGDVLGAFAASVETAILIGAAARAFPPS